jgi:hypothetical protein
MTSWDEVALGKLSRVLGSGPGQQMATKILGKMGRTSLQSADDLHHFGQILSEETGFAAAVGGLLIVHATLHHGNALLRDGS